MQAGVDSNDTVLLKDVWRAWTPELAGFVRHVENGLLEIFLMVCGSSALAPSCWVECHSAKQHRSSSPARLPGLGACLVSRRPSFVRPSRNDTRPPPDPYKACPAD